MKEYIFITVKSSNERFVKIRKYNFKNDKEFQTKIIELVEESRNEKTTIYMYKNYFKKNLIIIGIISSGLLYTN